MQITRRYILQMYEVQREVYGPRQLSAMYGRWMGERKKKKLGEEKEKDKGGGGTKK